jgi:hypothetical protein
MKNRAGQQKRDGIVVAGCVPEVIEFQPSQAFIVVPEGLLGISTDCNTGIIDNGRLG